MLYYLIISLIILASLLMCGVVLIQESKGGGLASSFSTQNNWLGVRKTTEGLEKVTWGLAIAMVVLSILSSAVVEKSAATETPIAAPTQTEQQTAPSNLPGNFNTEAPATEAPASETPAE